MVSFIFVPFSLPGLFFFQRRSLVAGRTEKQFLTLVVLRGTDVLEKHEATLVDLCILPEGQGKDAAVEKCIETLYQATYDMGDIEGPDCEDKDTECMIDSMFDMWDNDMVELRDVIKEKEEEAPEEVKKPAPWSSRSSPSGTYVRDPKTGKMMNIDE